MTLPPFDTEEDVTMGDYESYTSSDDVRSDEKLGCLEEQSPFISGVSLKSASSLKKKTRNPCWFYICIIQAVLFAGVVSFYYINPASRMACPGTSPAVQRKCRAYYSLLLMDSVLTVDL